MTDQASLAAAAARRANERINLELTEREALVVIAALSRTASESGILPINVTLTGAGDRARASRLAARLRSQL